MLFRHSKARLHSVSGVPPSHAVVGPRLGVNNKLTMASVKRPLGTYRVNPQSSVAWQLFKLWSGDKVTPFSPMLNHNSLLKSNQSLRAPAPIRAGLSFPTLPQSSLC